MLGMSALVHHDNVCLVAGEDANQSAALAVVLAEVGTETTLTVMNCFHRTPLKNSVDWSRGSALTLPLDSNDDHLKYVENPCKLRRFQSRIDMETRLKVS